MACVPVPIRGHLGGQRGRRSPEAPGGGGGGPERRMQGSCLVTRSVVGWHTKVAAS